MRKGGRQRRPRGILSWWKDGKVGSGPICSQIRNLVWIGGPQSLALVAEKDPLENLFEGWAGSEGRNLVMSRKECDHPNVQKHEHFKSGCSSSARVIQTPESAGSGELRIWHQLGERKKASQFDWSPQVWAQWSHAWGTFLEQTGLNPAAYSNVSHLCSTSYAKKPPPWSILCLQAFVGWR